MDRYNLGIVNESLYFLESALLIKKYHTAGSWDDVKVMVKEENLLQKIHTRTSQKISGEVIKRVKSAYPWELEEIIKSEDPEDWRFITLAFTARHYRILLDVIVNIIHYKWQGGDLILENYEIPSYIDSLKPDHPELLEITKRSMEDLLSTLKRNIKDGGLLVKSEGSALKITKPRISHRLRQQYLDEGSVDDLKLLLLKDNEIKKARS
ncbi:MAG: DUF1819 family protein [Spirochaetia bacterium]|jgi:hypothetical protein|nr:DUF1819 family protein [Spirochaetia bacterium]